VPKVYVFAGPNGAGKTTLAQEYLPKEGQVIQFINADIIAQGISPFAPETAEFASGRTMLKRIDELVSLKLDFAIETTLSGTWLVKRIHDWKSEGYMVHLCYVRLKSVELSISRVQERVSRG
jgi:predicted ABC-type ATPase